MLSLEWNDDCRIRMVIQHEKRELVLKRKQGGGVGKGEVFLMWALCSRRMNE
jgi:hypothetical protein